MPQGFHVAHVSSEVTPFAQTGGLGEVVGSLPVALSQLGLQQTVILPLYGQIDRAKCRVVPTHRQVSVRVGTWTFDFQIHQSDVLPGVRTLLLESRALFGGDSIYSPAPDSPVENDVRFFAFGRAAIKCSQAFPGQAIDCFHLHDWTPGLIAWELARLRGRYVPTVTTIHNIAMQGNFPASSVERLGLPVEDFSPNGFEFYERLSFLKAALHYSDKITTVSPTYAKEIQQPELAFGLDPLLRHRSDDLVGIVNGIDIERYDPMGLDNEFPFSPNDLRGKQKCADALRAECGLRAPSPGAPREIVAYVGRLSVQKGLDWLFDAAEPLLRQERIALVVVGQGEPRYEERIRQLKRRFPGLVGEYIGYSQPVAKRVYAAASLFAMPSAFEPCGLAQMIAMRYGTIPVVRQTGGLADTVSEGTTGFLFRNQSAASLRSALERALDYVAQNQGGTAMRQRIMAQDFSWRRSALKYAELYQRVWERTLIA
jgi:starch synthase